MLNLYTFVLDYRGGTYISQIKGLSPENAAEEWIKKKLDLQALGVRDYNVEDILTDVDRSEESPAPLCDLTNVWCMTFLLDDDLALVNIIKTNSR
ncbi:hypothetical protein DENIS_0880 [Desulfonema ishimotonii]|uniref:Uncharacterized protein n=1 Tax=Desulfonema ishimotonii TaxID=45657 RepID=A0A401FSK3_9BACT|nr:hypothetical protein [Desulfonema ishimotonii]GBC59938.1 hypothetical protein DENIS_0880 [Desulfonema ishimotonii]